MLQEKYSLQDNKILSRITLTTSLGDWLSYFALIKLATDTSGSIIIGTLSIAMKSAAVAVAAVLIPMFVGVYSNRSIILVTQWLSAALMAVVCFSTACKVILPIPAIYSTLFLQTSLKQLFDAARETHSKSLARHENDHRPLQAQLLAGFYGAQFLGPLVAFFLLLKSPVWIPLLVDSISFAVAGFLARKISSVPPTQSYLKPSRFLRPFSYLKGLPNLRDILILRSTIWIPIGLYNILLFQVVLHHYELPLNYSTIPYAALGLGAAVSSFLLTSSKNKMMLNLDKMSDGVLACLAQVLLGVSTLGFLVVPSFGVAMIFVFITGLAMGLNSVATLTLRRKFSTAEQLPEIMGLELLIGRVTDVVIMTSIATALNQKLVSYEDGVCVAIAMFVVSGLAHLRFKPSSIKQKRV